MFVLCCGTTVSSMVRHLCPMYVFLIKCMSLITACFALCIGLTLMSVLQSYMYQLNSTCISFFTVDHLDFVRLYLFELVLLNLSTKHKICKFSVCYSHKVHYFVSR